MIILLVFDIKKKITKIKIMLHISLQINCIKLMMEYSLGKRNLMNKLRISVRIVIKVSININLL